MSVFLFLYIKWVFRAGESVFNNQFNCQNKPFNFNSNPLRVRYVYSVCTVNTHGIGHIRSTRNTSFCCWRRTQGCVTDVGSSWRIYETKWVKPSWKCFSTDWFGFWELQHLNSFVIIFLVFFCFMHLLKNVFMFGGFVEILVTSCVFTEQQCCQVCDFPAELGYFNTVAVGWSSPK